MDYTQVYRNKVFVAMLKNVINYSYVLQAE